MRSLLLLALTALAIFAPVARADAPSTLRITKPPVSVSGAPRTLVTLVVPVPLELDSASRVSFQVVLSGSVEVVGRLEGQLEPDSRRPIMLTLRVPATALVGLLDVADVQFIDETGRAVTVPIILRVPSVRAIRLTGLRDLSAINPGDRLELVYRVQNLGNDVEQLTFAASVSAEWRPELVEGASVTLAPYEMQDVTLRLRVPTTQLSGSAAVSIAVTRRGARADTTTVASAHTLLRVREVSSRPVGLVFQPFVGAAASRDGTGFASGLRVVGPISENIRLDASFAPPPNVEGLGLFGLNNVGIARVPLNARLSGRDWGVDVGATQGELSPLTGNSFGGRGARASFERDGREIRVIAARPAARQSREGSMVGAGAWWNTSLGRVGGSISSLTETMPGFAVGARNLRAFGADWESNEIFAGTRLTSGLALRQFDGASSLGFSADVAHRSERTRVRAGAMLAPGGSGAFAAATTVMSLQAERELSDRFAIDGSTQRIEDSSPFVQSSQVTSGSLGARYAVRSNVSTSIRFLADENSARGVAGGVGQFGGSQTAVQTGVNLDLAEWRMGVEGRFARLERSTTLFSGAVDERVAGQRSVSLNVSRALPANAAFSVVGALVQSGPGLGLPAQLVSAAARVSNLTVQAGDLDLRFEQELRVAGTSRMPAQVVLRSGVTARMPQGYEVTAVAERNPLLTLSSGGSGWIFGLRVALTSEVLSSNRLMTPGNVFEDLNGNGRRDEGEVGVAGVALMYDRMRFTTSRKGEYRIPASYRGRLRVDPLTIPVGLVQHPRLMTDTVERRDIPLVPTGTVEIELSLQFDEDGRLPAGDLARASVWLRDTDGFEWVGRRVSDTKVVFEHAPVGIYALRIDLSRTGEQLRAEEVQVRLERGENASLVVPVRGRSVRMVAPPRQGGGRGGVAPRGGGARLNPRSN